jgi:uncharacterized membrane protein
MRRHQLIAPALFCLALGAAGLARAADSDDAVCAAYKSNWEAVRSGGNLAAMTSAANSISAECPTLRHQANAVVTSMRRANEHRTAPARTASHESRDDRAAATAAAADDAAYAMARSLNTVDAYNAYLSTYPDGRHAADAMAAKEPPPSTTSSTSVSTTSTPITLVVCNKAKTDISVALVYEPVGETVSWRYIGWYVIHPTECNTLVDTDTQLLYLYAKGTDGTVWGNKNIGSDPPVNHCLVADAAYDFMIKATDTTCPANAVAEPFFTVKPSVTSGTYTFNFVLNS